MFKTSIFGAIVALAVSALPISAATVVTVDDFSTFQAPITTDKTTFPTGVSSTVSGPGILGGSRKLTVVSKQNGGGFTTSAAVSGSMSVFSNSPIGYGEVSLGYGTVAPLGSFDLTAGGAQQFRFNVVSSDLGVSLFITATDSLARTSVISSALGGGLFNTHVDYAFSGFTGTADLTDINKLQFRFVNSNGNSDFVLGKISTADVPVPAAGVLLAGALGALGVHRKRRRS